MAWPNLAWSETLAGASITNTATLHFDQGGEQRTVSSNAVTLAVAERLDVSLARAGDIPAVVAAADVAVPFQLGNPGNGSEAFQLDAALDARVGQVRLIATDDDGDGRFDPSHDRVLTDGRTASLAPGATVRLLVVIAAADAPTAGTLTLGARALTGSGAPGTVLAGLGDGGADAVVGPTGAAARVAVPLEVSPAAAAPTLTKTQAVLAPDGSARPTSGATITYTLEARFPGTTAAAAISDPIPAGTAFLPGSLTLDGAALTDAADQDAGRMDAGGVAVALGDQPSGATHTVRFTVTIQ